MANKTSTFERSVLVAIGVAVLVGLYGLSRYNFPLFHILAESASILIAFGIFVFTWNSRRFLRGNFFLLIGVAYLFVGSLDLLHTFAYRGVGIFQTPGSNLATQLWIAARYLEAVSLFVGSVLLGRKIKPIRAFLGYVIIATLILAAIFVWQIFPVCYVTLSSGTGFQTPFKILSELLICLLLLATLLRIRAHSSRFHPGVFVLLCASLLVTVLSELSFMLYADVYGIFNAIGHLFKVVSFYLLYKAIIETGLVRPYDLLFRDLQESERSLARERSLLKEMLTQMPAGVVIADAETEEVVLANRSAAETWHQLVDTGKNTRLATQKVFRADGTPYRPEQWPLRRALRGGKKVRHEQVEVQRQDGSFATLLVDAAPVRDPKGQIQAAVSTFYDVTERQRMEQSLRRARNQLEARVKQRTAELARANEALHTEVRQRRRVESELREYAREWRTTFDAINEAVCLMDLEGRIKKHNNSFNQLVGQTEQDPIGQKCHELLDCGFQTDDACPLRRMQRTRQRESAEITINRRHYLATADPLNGESGELCGCVHTLRDVTEEKKAERKIRNYQEELRSLASELTLAEERERRRLSTVLHDNIAQSLALSKIKLGGIKTAVDHPETRKEVDSVRNLIDESIGRTRSLIFELSPPILYQMGLEPALETLADNFRDRHKLPVQFHGDGGQKPLPKELEVVLFQSARELLTNAVKHADASQLELSIRQHDGQVRVAVRDDGSGFNTAEIGLHQHRNGGYGLFSIRERMERFKGRFTIKSEIGSGTRAVLIAPIGDEQEET